MTKNNDNNYTCTRIQCPDNCFGCFNKAGICSLCDYGFYLNLNGSCSPSTADLNCENITYCDACLQINGVSTCVTTHPQNVHTGYSVGT